MSSTIVYGLPSLGQPSDAVVFTPMIARTHQDGFLAVRLRDGEIVHQLGDDPRRDVAPLLLLCPPSLPHIALAASDSVGSVRFGQSSDAAPILALRVCPRGLSGVVALRHPSLDRYVCAHPHPSGPERSAPATIDRPHASGWETFRLEAALEADIALPARLRDGAALAALIAACTPDPEVLLAWFEHATDDALRVAGSAILHYLPPDDRHDFAAALLRAPRVAGRLAQVWPGDPCADSLLTRLISWSSRRQVLAVSPTAPATAVAAHERDATLPARLLTAARASVRPRKTLAVLSSARNEGVYLLDWIAHHRSIGVEHFFIYSNDNDDQSDRMLRALAGAGVITYLPNDVPPGMSGQDRALSHALLELPEILDYRWTAIIDVDEFIVVDPAQVDSLPALLALHASRGADAVALNWRMYTPSGHHLFDDVPIPERFLRREASLNPHIKSVIRTGRAIGSTPHAPVWPGARPGRAVDASGFPHHGSNRPFWDSQFRHHHEPGPAWINHYFLRSLPDYVWKAARNRGDAAATSLRFPPDHGFLGTFLASFGDPSTVEDRTILASADPARRERARLSAIPGVADAHASSLETFVRTTTRLMRDILMHAREIAEPHRAEFVAIVERSLADGVIVGAGVRSRSLLAGVI